MARYVFFDFYNCWLVSLRIEEGSVVFCFLISSRLVVYDGPFLASSGVLICTQ